MYRLVVPEADGAVVATTAAALREMRTLVLLFVSFEQRRNLAGKTRLSFLPDLCDPSHSRSSPSLFVEPSQELPEAVGTKTRTASRYVIYEACHSASPLLANAKGRTCRPAQLQPAINERDRDGFTHHLYPLFHFCSSSFWRKTAAQSRENLSSQ